MYYAGIVVIKSTAFKNMLAQAILFIALPFAASAMSVVLTPSVPSPAQIATLVTFTANASDSAPGTLWYRFRARGYNQDFQTIKDFGPENILTWTEHAHEQSWEIEVDVRNTSTGDVSSASSSFQFQSVVSGTEPVIAPASHPMVFLYSAPACSGGHRMRAQFTSPGGVIQYTPFQACKTGSSMNFYLAGMLGGAQYSVNHIIDTGTAFKNGPILTLTTPASRTDLTTFSVDEALPASGSEGILLHSTLLTPATATDLNGNLLWYYPNFDISSITRPAPGGLFFGILENPTGDQSAQVFASSTLSV